MKEPPPKRTAQEPATPPERQPRQDNSLTPPAPQRHAPGPLAHTHPTGAGDHQPTPRARRESPRQDRAPPTPNTRPAPAPPPTTATSRLTRCRLRGSTSSAPRPEDRLRHLKPRSGPHEPARTGDSPAAPDPRSGPSAAAVYRASTHDRNHRPRPRGHQHPPAREAATLISTQQQIPGEHGASHTQPRRAARRVHCGTTATVAVRNLLCASQ